MSVILRLGAVNTDTPYSRIISNGSRSPSVREVGRDTATYPNVTPDAPDYDMPLDLSPGHDDPYQSPTQTYAGCFGLPYQDHNYGAPPPPSPLPPPPQPPSPPLVKVKEAVDEVKEEIVVTSETPPIPPQTPPPSPPPREEEVDAPTRCICDFVHDDGYMIQCDKCSVWQHIWCMGLDRDSIPEVYLCEMCQPRAVDRARAREFQVRKREFLKSLLAHDSSATDTDPEEASNRLHTYGHDTSAPAKQKMKMKLKKRKERHNNNKPTKRIKKDFKKEKENNHKEADKKNKLILKDFPVRKEFPRNIRAKKEKLSRKIRDMKELREKREADLRKQEEKLLIEELQLKVDAVSSKVDSVTADLSTISTLSAAAAEHPAFQNEDTQEPWDIDMFNEWEQNYEHARYNQYSTYVEEYLNTPYINGSVMNDIADLVTDGLRVQRCYIKELKNNRKGLQSMCAIPNGQPIIEVIGKVMTRQQYDKDNFGQRRLSPFVFFYGTVFDLDLVIDASDYGNDARFIRRSCQANAEVRHVVAGGQAHFITVARREIPERMEITIPFDYDYKKWNFCVECACLRNNCPVARYQKRRLRFQKLQFGGQQNKKIKDMRSETESPTKSPVRPTIHSPMKSPVRSPVSSPVCSPVKSPIKILPLLPPIKKAEPGVEKPPVPVLPTTPEKMPVTPPTTSPPKMVRRSQVLKSVSRRNSVNASTQASHKPLIVPPEPPNIVDTSHEPITAPEPTALRSSEVDILTSPEAKADKTPTAETPDTTQPKKLTREERKMEAIMKAFEKMEKRQERRRHSQQAAHQDTAPTPTTDTPTVEEELTDEKAEVDVQGEVPQPPVKKKKGRKKKEIKCEEPLPVMEEQPEVPEKPAVVPSPVKEEPVQIVSPVKEEPVIETPVPVEVATEETKTTEVAVDVAEEPETSEAVTVCEDPLVEVDTVETTEVPLNKPMLRDRPPPKGRKAKKSTARRRARYSSGTSAASGSETATTSQDEASNPAPTHVASCPVTPLPQSDPTTPATAGTPPSFTFKKRHLMNEWLSERNLDFKSSVKTEPLEVAVPDDTMFVQCRPSPRNSMDRLRRNSQSSGSCGRLPVAVESSAGSAKKRWLRQAMGEGSSDSGLLSPVPSSGGMSPNPLVSVPSPCGSPPTDFVTPLKKRRLARESLSRESFSSESPTPTPTATPVIGTVSGSYFSLSDDVDVNGEQLKIRNGFRSFFLPVRPTLGEDDELEKPSSIMKSCDEAAIDVTEHFKPAVAVVDSVSDSCVAESRVCLAVAIADDGVNQKTDVAIHRVVTVAEVDSSVVDDTGIDVGQARGSGQNMISEDSVVMSSGQGVARTLHDVREQPGDNGSASAVKPEPDSSESTSSTAGVHSDVECDSMVSDTKVVAGTGGSSEVDSTQNSEQLKCNAFAETMGVSSHQDTSVDSNTNVANVASCDSCSTEVQIVHSETHDINVNVLSSSNSSSSDKLCSSSSILSSDSDLNQCEVCDSAKSNSPQKSQVDSSTDKMSEVTITTDSSSEVGVSGLSEISTSNSFVLAEIESTGVNSSANVNTCEYVLPPPHMVELMDTSEQVAIDSSGLLNSTRYFTSFGFDMHHGTEMVVDSTTQPINPALSSGLSSLTAYDSDSMDVSSASDGGGLIGGSGVGEELRRSDDAMTGYMEATPSTSTQEMQPPKEKKKVSLQEYRKRVKEKTSTTSAVSSITAALGKNSARTFDLEKTLSKPSIRSTLTPPIKIEKPIKLDKLPTLPSLPLFEPQHKEFKSSSDLLSPIFNRKEKQEEARKPLSLSERLKQEFGLDDYTDTDAESGNEHSAEPVSGQQLSELDEPPPPPPPPPPSIRRASAQLNQSLSQLKMSSPAVASGSELTGSAISGSAISEKIQSLLSLNFSLLKKNHTVTSTAQLAASTTGQSSLLQAPLHSGIPRLSAADTGPKMVPPPLMAQTIVLPPAGKPQKPGTSGILPTPGAKTTIPSTNDLTEKLAAALKALKEQTSLSGSSKTGVSMPNTGSMAPVPKSPANPTINLNNGVSSTMKVTNTKPQVFDYGHRSSGLSKRQNSYPSSTITSGSMSKSSVNSGVSSSLTSYQGYVKTPPNGHSGNHVAQSNLYSSNSASGSSSSKHYKQGYNSPHTPGSQQQTHKDVNQHQPKPFNKQHSLGPSHKYSGLK